MTVPISRAEGYRRGASKEALGLTVASDFLFQLTGVRPGLIASPEDNYRFGDLVFPSGDTVEVKRQPIDPDRYQRNFVEVCEITGNPRHAGGMDALAVLLETDVEQLAQVRCCDRRTGQMVPLGRPPYVSVSIRSIFTAPYTIYVNPGENGSVAHLYLYGRAEITTAIRDAVPCGVTRGAGASNADTIGVTIPLANARWSRPPGEAWTFDAPVRPRPVPVVHKIEQKAPVIPLWPEQGSLFEVAAS